LPIGQTAPVYALVKARAIAFGNVYGIVSWIVNRSWVRYSTSLYLKLFLIALKNFSTRFQHVFNTNEGSIYLGDFDSLGLSINLVNW